MASGHVYRTHRPNTWLRTRNRQAMKAMPSDGSLRAAKLRKFAGCRLPTKKK
jgi:hypothetical protein